MDIRDKVVVITGAAAGIGKALAMRFAGDGATDIIVSDRDGAGAQAVADAIIAQGRSAVSLRVDVGVENDVRALVELAIARCGRVDLFCSNAGIIEDGGPDASNEAWARSWSVNVMAHVYAARAALPAMLDRGGGYFLNTCSSAGLLTSLGAAPYAVSKHAAVAFAEWLAITYGDRGIKASALCPQAVRTDMLAAASGGDAADAVRAAGRIIEPDEVAGQVVAALAEERFLILTHEEVGGYMQRKAADTDRWLAGMRRFAAAS